MLLAIAFARLQVDIESIHEPPRDAIIIDFEEPKEEPPKQEVKTVPTPEPVAHERVSETENTRQVSGTDNVTQTVNPKALFKMNKGGADEPQDVGNPKAKQGDKDLAKGDGGGLNAFGNAELDEGLKGRGLVGSLPRPSYPPGNRGGKVVVRVAVDQGGNVTSADYEPKGSTTSDAKLVSAAIAAARRARFVESRAFVQGGLITYVFRMD